MKNLTIYTFAVMALVSSTAWSDTVLLPSTGPVKTPSIATPDMVNPYAPVAGENSFTEEQARERIKKAGYSKVGALSLDSNGIWRGTAILTGASVKVSLDYQGNVTSAPD